VVRWKTAIVPRGGAETTARTVKLWTLTTGGDFDPFIDRIRVERRLSAEQAGLVSPGRLVEQAPAIHYGRQPSDSSHPDV
jgi:hypothetical protein